VYHGQCRILLVIVWLRLPLQTAESETFSLLQKEAADCVGQPRQIGVSFLWAEGPESKIDHLSVKR